MAILQLFLFSIFFLWFSCTISSSSSSSSLPPCKPRNLYVGGKKGWVKNPQEDYTAWASRNEFHVNDNLVFRYKKKDSVLVVTKEAYLSCNTMKPIKKMTSGDSWFPLNRLGEFFFISGRRGHCEKGQKLMVVVAKVDARAHPPPHPSRSHPCVNSPTEPWLSYICSSAPNIILRRFSLLWVLMLVTFVAYLNPFLC